MPDANTFAAGAPLYNGTGYEKGQVRVFEWNGIGWVQKGNNIDGGTDDDQAGRAVHMPDVNTLAIGAPDNSFQGPIAGQVRVFTWNGNSWVQKGSNLYGNAPEAQAGDDVFMPDANTLAFGAPGSFTSYGYAFIYSWNGNDWVPKGFPIMGEELGDGFGKSVSMPDSNTIAVGAWLNGNHGHVRVYSWNGSSWVQRGTDIDGLTGSERFGTSVSMPDGNNIGVGAYHHDGNGFGAGAVRMFNWDGNDWIQKGSEILGDSAEDFCGFSVSMPDSNHIAIGYPESSSGPRPGRTKIFLWNGNAWVRTGIDIVGESNDDNGGYSVCMPDTNTIAIGAINNDGGGNSSAGHVRVYGILSWTGQEEMNYSPNLTIDPNPATTFIKITSQTFDKVIGDIFIHDLSGREMEIIRKTGDQQVLDISEYENGIYILQITSEKSNLTGKIIVQR